MKTGRQFWISKKEAKRQAAIKIPAKIYQRRPLSGTWRFQTFQEMLVIFSFFCSLVSIAQIDIKIIIVYSDCSIKWRGREYRRCLMLKTIYWRDAGVVERGTLLRCYPFTRIQGSNPCLSAHITKTPKRVFLLCERWIKKRFEPGTRRRRVGALERGPLGPSGRGDA